MTRQEKIDYIERLLRENITEQLGVCICYSCKKALADARESIEFFHELVGEAL
jgi:hypothetical protein